MGIKEFIASRSPEDILKDQESCRKLNDGQGTIEDLKRVLLVYVNAEPQSDFQRGQFVAYKNVLETLNTIK